jgi:hypothetical protein
VLALLVAPILVIFAILLIYLPIAYLHDAQTDWRQETRSLLSQAKSADTLETELNGQLAGLQTSRLWSKFYVAEKSGAAATSLQSDVSSFLANVQVSAQSLVPIPSAQLPRFTKIGTKLTASMKIDQLRGFLAAVANHQRYLRVEQATVVAPQAQSAAENPPLAVTLEVYGYELPGAAKSRTEALAVLAMRAAE